MDWYRSIFTHIPKGYFTGIEMFIPMTSVSEVALKDLGK